MTSTCSNCGAPLNLATAPSGTVRCAYCGLEQPLRPGRAPRTAVPAVAPGAARVVGALASLGVLLTVGGTVVGLGMLRGRVEGATSISLVSTLSPKAVAVERLSKQGLDVTPERMAASLGGTIDGHGSDRFELRLALTGSRFDAVTFSWDKRDTSHATGFLFTASGDAVDDRADKKLAELLGRRYTRSQSFSFDTASLSASGQNVSGSVSMAASLEPAKHWRAQADALWNVARAAVLGLPVPVSEADQRDWLGRGYRPSALGQVDLDTDIDASSAALERLFPAVESRAVIGLEHTVAIDHPWFGDAQLTWPNKKGAKLATVLLRPPPDISNFANQNEIEACVEATFGKPKDRSEGDHLKGTHDTIWYPKAGGEIRVYEHLVKLELSNYPFTKPMPKSTWVQVLGALDACGRR